MPESNAEPTAPIASPYVNASHEKGTSAEKEALRARLL